MKKIMLMLSVVALLSSCVSQKKYAALEKQYKTTQDLLNSATVKLNSCLEERAALQAKSKILEESLADMRKTNQDLIQSSKDLTMLTSKGATNLEKSLESLKEKDLKISRLQDALNLGSCNKP